MTRCLAVGCRECQCFQNLSCSTGTFSLSKTTITTLCKHSSHVTPSLGKGPRCLGPFPELGSSGPALLPQFPPLQGNGQLSHRTLSLGPWQAGLTRPSSPLPKLLQVNAP